MPRYVSKSGVTLDEETIEKLADEAELGYEQHELVSQPARGRPSLDSADGPSKTIQFRVEGELSDAIREEAARQKITLSEYVRRVLRENVPSH